MANFAIYKQLGYMDCAAVCLPCCVGMCCIESSWLGVRRMLRNEGLVVG